MIVSSALTKLLLKQDRCYADQYCTLLPPYIRMVCEFTKLLKPKCRVCPHDNGTTLYAYCKHKGKCHYNDKGSETNSHCFRYLFSILFHCYFLIF